MKKAVFCLVCAALICMAFSIGVFAARDVSLENSIAADLRELGLFNGVSETNFDLERAPTRVEVIVMLIRVLGREKEALEGTWEHPFTDVPNWANAYIGYAYANKLTQGVSATRFGTGTAGAGTYLTFMLRALGYSDEENLDFAWNNPYELAEEKGILCSHVDRNDFWRADIVTISYLALGAKLKGTDVTLADSLIEKGIFTTEGYREYYHPEKLTPESTEVVVPGDNVPTNNEIVHILSKKNVCVLKDTFVKVALLTNEDKMPGNIDFEYNVTSSDPNVAVALWDAETVDQPWNIIIKGISAGEATITLSNTYNNQVETIGVKVTDRVDISSAKWDALKTHIVKKGEYLSTSDAYYFTGELDANIRYILSYNTSQDLIMLMMVTYRKQDVIDLVIGLAKDTPASVVLSKNHDQPDSLKATGYLNPKDFVKDGTLTFSTYSGAWSEIDAYEKMAMNLSVILLELLEDKFFPSDVTLESLGFANCK